MISAQDIKILQEMGPTTLFYVGSPYSSYQEKERERFGQVCAACAEMFSAGILCFSPIAHSHPISHAIRSAALPTDFGFWSRFDKTMLARCDAMIVLQLEGWTASKGLRAEIDYAMEIGKRTLHLAPELPQ